VWKETLQELLISSLHPLLSTRTMAIHLQSILKQLVHARHLRRDAQVDRTVANLHDETATNIRVDLHTSTVSKQIPPP